MNTPEHPAAEFVGMLNRHLHALRGLVDRERSRARPPTKPGNPYLWKESWHHIMLKSAAVPRHMHRHWMGLTLEWGGLQAHMQHLAGVLPTVMTWDRTRDVFRFDADMLQQLAQTEGSGALPVHLLNRLPSLSLFIETPGGRFPIIDRAEGSRELPSSGFWISVEGYRAGQRELMVVPLVDFSGVPNPEDYAAAALGTGLVGISLKGYACASPSASIQDLVLETNESKGGKTEGKREYARLAGAWMSRAVNMVLYLASESPDVSEVKEAHSETPVPTASLPPSRLRLPPLRVWDVGLREGAVFRVAKESIRSSEGASPTENDNDAATRRVHWRNAHWHSFWVGSRDSDERRLTVKWVAQTLVNARHHHPELGDELPVVRRRVRP